MPVDTYSSHTAIRAAELSEYAIDDEIDLLAANEEEICPICGTLLLEYEEDSFELRCPICELFSADADRG